jgi:pimeloyl-ACP methyl ester carboxylesterase
VHDEMQDDWPLIAREARDEIAGQMRAVALSDGSERRVLRAGSGPAVVFVPMLAEMNFVYAPQLRALRTSYTTVLYEPLLELTRVNHVAARAEELDAVLDAMDLDAAHIVAWSDAGAGAYEFARTRPERCLSFTAISLADAYQFPWLVSRLMTLLRTVAIEGLVPPSISASFIAYYIGGPLVRPWWFWKEAKQIAELTRILKYNLLPNLLEHSPREFEVRCPAMVIWGEGDRLVSRAQARRMADILRSDGGLRVVPKGEHFPLVLSAPIVCGALREFLDRNS